MYHNNSVNSSVYSHPFIGFLPAINKYIFRCIEEKAEGKDSKDDGKKAIQSLEEERERGENCQRE